jgi:hypothetical protein
MLGSTGLKRSVESPGALQLAIREWQRQLIEMAEAANRQAKSLPTADD